VFFIPYVSILIMLLELSLWNKWLMTYYVKAFVPTFWMINDVKNIPLQYFMLLNK